MENIKKTILANETNMANLLEFITGKIADSSTPN